MIVLMNNKSLVNQAKQLYRKTMLINIQKPAEDEEHNCTNNQFWHFLNHDERDQMICDDKEQIFETLKQNFREDLKRYEESER